MANTLRFKRGLLAGLPSAAVGEPLFTTDTFDLYIGTASGTQKYQKFITSGTTSQLLRGDGSLLTMPIVLTSPSNGQVLKYNGTSWVNDSDAGITGSGVAGQVAYFTGATTQGGSNNLFWDASNSRLGIGTNAPTSRLHVTSTAWNSTDPFVSFVNLDPQGVESNGLYLQAGAATSGAYIANFVDYNAVSAFYVRGDRNVGIGTTSPLHPLDVTSAGNTILYIRGGSATSLSRLVFGTSANTDRGFIDYDNTSGARFMSFKLAENEAFRISNSRNFIVNNTSTDNGLRFQVTGDGYFSGSVGIGTTPTEKLEVSASNVMVKINAATNSYPQLAFYENSSLKWNAYNDFNNDNYVLGNSTGPKFYLNQEGNLGLGVVPSAWASGTRAIDFGSGSALWNPGSTTNTYLTTNAYFDITDNRWEYKGTGGASNYHQFGNEHRWNQAAAGTANQPITFTQAMTLDASGRLGIGLTAPTERLVVRAIGNAYVNSAALSIENVTGANKTYITNANGNLYITNNTTIDHLALFSNGNLSLSGNSDSGERLQVNGTMRVSGASTLSGGVTLGHTGGVAVTFPGGQAFRSNGGIFIDYGNGGTGDLVFRRGSGVTNTLTLAVADGAATFSSSVATGGNMNVNGLTLGRGTGNLITNTVFGSGVMTLNTTGFGNLALGYFSLYNNLGGYYNTAVGYDALYNNTDGFENIGIGFRPLYSNTTGDDNIGIGYQAGNANTTGNNNIFLGYRAGSAGSANANTTGSNNIYIGLNTVGSAATNSNEIVIGAGTIGNGTNTATWGNTSITNHYFTGAATFSGNVGIGGTPAQRLDVQGSANSIQARFGNVAGRGLTIGTSAISGTNDAGVVFNAPTATDGTLVFQTSSTDRMTLNSSGLNVATAIAIGTTPDTNLPFKILKNINSTVGIRFENTSTGNVAYSAVQFGTDVTGGTKFANLVYSSSGITESGAYKQNGTSIINTGTGGLNLLAVDGTIRFFTSSSNGTLRAEIANDGFINHYTGTAPSTNLTDGYRQYSADITAGNAAPHFRTENGGIIKLYQQTTGVTSATYIGGAGTGLTDSDTFDGYTIAQIVKALRNAGLLA